MNYYLIEIDGNWEGGGIVRNFGDNEEIAKREYKKSEIRWTESYLIKGEIISTTDEDLPVEYS